MRHFGILCLLISGIVAGSTPAGAIVVGQAVRDAVRARDAGTSVCARTGCVQPIQMWPMTPRAAVMPADQRELLERLLSRRLSDFINSGERQVLSAALARGERLSGDAVGELVAMLREREGMLTQQAQRAQQEEEERRRQAEAERRRQEVARAEAAERERRRQEELARAEAAEQERRRQEAAARADPAAAERSRQEQEVARAEAAERERRREQEAALARAKAEEERAALAAAEEALERAKAAEQERLQEEAELARAKAEEEALARAAAVEAARSFVFYDDLPPLRPL